jgi:hypothetical protein
MATRCESVGFGMTFNVEEGGVSMILSLFENEGDVEPYAVAMIKPSDAVVIATRFTGGAFETARMEAEILALPPDDRAAGIQRLMERLASDTN